MNPLETFSRQHRLCIRHDECGDPIIPGKRGQSQLYFAGDELCLMVLDGPIVQRSRWKALGGKLWLGDISPHPKTGKRVQDVKITGVPLLAAELPLACLMLPGLQWYALQVHQQKEKIIAQLLQQKGFDPYLPTYRVTRRWCDRVKVLDQPLFPGYLFCRLDLSVRLPILTTPGVFSFIGAGKKPIAIPEEELEAVARIVNSTVSAGPWPYIACGDKVTISQGPLRGVEGIFVSLKNDFKVVVSITLLQRSVAVEVERNAVLPSSVARHLLGRVLMCNTP